MKYINRSVPILLILSMLITPLAGCGLSGSGGNNSSDVTQIVDKTKTQITFNVFNGGYGYAWAVDAAREWNETND